MIRKKYVALAPEEWVRQHMVNFLIYHRDYPKSLISVESGLKYAKVSKRTDVVTFDNQGQPFMIVECKAPEVRINQKTFDQIAVYNKTLNARYLVITNGLEHFVCYYDVAKNGYKFLEDIPSYKNAE